MECRLIEETWVQNALNDIAGNTWEALSGGQNFPALRATHHHEMGALGRAVQVDSVKPTLKPPGTKRLNLKYDKVLSSFASEINLRRYSWVRPRSSL
jgi:hypothetical protein